MAGPSEKRSGTFSKRQVVKVFKYATSNLAGRRCRPGQARPGFHQGDFVTLPRRNKSCSSCIKFVGSAVKLLVYAATLLINREEAEGMANGKPPGYSRCSRLRQPLPSPPLVPLLIDAENPARVLDSPGEFFPHPSSPFSRLRPNIRRLSPFRHLFEKNLNLESEKAAG